MAEWAYVPIFAKVDKLPKYQLKVKMCCLSCQEKVIDEISDVHGVSEVRAERFQSKVVVVAATSAGVDKHEVLRKARKVHRRAKFVELDDKEKAKKGDKKKEEEAEIIYTVQPMMHHYGGHYYAPHPEAYMPSEYRLSHYGPSQSYAPRYHIPPLSSHFDDGYFRQFDDGYFRQFDDGYFRHYEDGYFRHYADDLLPQYVYHY